MAKKSKIQTPDWILKGGDSPSTKKKKGKTFSIRRCPKCNSDDLKVVIGEVGVWECAKCKWKGKNVKLEDLDEDEFMKYLDDKGEEVA
jgi:hypothetical protein